MGATYALSVIEDRVAPGLAVDIGMEIDLKRFLFLHEP